MKNRSKKGRGRRTRVADADFVKAWTKAQSMSTVADAVRMTYSGVQARAALLRGAGVKLPKFPRRKREVDVAGLNALLKRGH
jgi:hypothetical protein